MHILVLIAIMVVVGTGVAFRSSKSEVTHTTTLGESTSLAPSPTELPSPTVLPTLLPSSTRKSSPTVTARPTNVPVSPSSLVYPGATVLSSTNFESSDNHEKITDWYKDKIRSQGYSTKSFVTTATNGEILNKLAASKSGSSVTVEITKSSSSSQTLIRLVLDK